MSSPQRRAEKRAEQERLYEERQAEEWRYSQLSLWEKIEEIEDIHDVKRVLHEIAERLETA